ncbi:MAG: 50S ribosomal protein L23 [bacterium]|nr:50S ribosomal protein L23 [bacterium]
MKYIPQSIIVRPVITERATEMRDKNNKYLFEISTQANKQEVKAAIEELFKVKVESVNILNVLGKFRRIRGKLGKKSDWKKAFVTLKEGNKIDIAGA